MKLRQPTNTEIPLPLFLSLICAAFRRACRWSGVANHPYRTHPKLQVKGVPTLLRWGKTSANATLVEEECAQADLLEMFTED